MPSSPKFSEHFYDHYFELFVRQITYLCFRGSFFLGGSILFSLVLNTFLYNFA